MCFHVSFSHYAHWFLFLSQTYKPIRVFSESNSTCGDFKKFKSLLKTLSSFGGGVADKDLTFNQKFLRRGSGRVEELE